MIVEIDDMFEIRLLVRRWECAYLSEFLADAPDFETVDQRRVREALLAAMKKLA